MSKGRIYKSNPASIDLEKIEDARPDTFKYAAGIGHHYAPQRARENESLRRNNS